MYFCNLKIFVISDSKPESEEIVSFLGHEEPLEDCSYTLATAKFGDECDVSNDSAVIINRNRGELVKYKRVNAERIVFITGAKELASIDKGTLSSVDDLWIMPDEKNDAGLLEVYFAKMLKSMKDNFDNRRQEICFNTVIDSLPDLVWFKDNDGAHLIVNDEFCGVVEKTKKQIYKQHHNYIWDVPEDDYENGEAVCRQSEDVVVRERKTCQFQERITTKDGMRQLVTYKSPLIDTDGTIFGTCGMGHDITDLQNVSKELMIIINSIPFGLAITDISGNIIAINAFLEKFFPNTSDCIGKPYKQWRDGLDMEKLGVEHGEEEFRMSIKGSDHIIRFRGEPILDIFGENIGAIQFIRDVTIQYNFEQQNIKHANTDFLTGLNNRRSLFEYLTGLATDSKLSLVMLDLDKFKSVNDTYGHALGDEALEITSRVLEESFPDGFIARLGGDEFLACLVGEYELPEVEKRTQNLLDTLIKKYSHKSEFKALSASAGIAQERLAACDTKSIENLIKKSDDALYTAKQSGRARYCVNNS